MSKKPHIYIAIDLKSFYASVECIERGLNPLTTNLVVADSSRTEKTICLAVSPSLKSYGISGRPRLFEVIQHIKKINARRLCEIPGHQFINSSYDDVHLKSMPNLSVSYIIAPPRMALYIEYSVRIYHIYLRYIAPEDIHVYSIDEVFMDVTNYLDLYKLSAHELTAKIIKEVLKETGITATAGIGTNLYLCKVAMDIIAKHKIPDQDGVRIAELDELSYRKLLWDYRPLTDFWRVGKGYAKKLEKNGIYTMGDVARCSMGNSEDFYNEELLYQLFGINAELLIDHAWGWEPCTIADIKAYKPTTNSLTSGQVLPNAYHFEKAKLIVKEMTDLLVLDLIDKRLVTDQIVLSIGYDAENLMNPEIKEQYKGPITTDFYGRQIPKHSHGTVNLEQPTSSTKVITKAVIGLYKRIVNKNLLIRRIRITANHIVDENTIKKKDIFEQLNLFTDYRTCKIQKEKEKQDLMRERKMQEAVLKIRKKYGKNAILKGMNFEDGATTIQRNKQIGGHKA